MPGLQEITRVINMIQSKLGGKEPTVNGKVIKLMALHGALAPSEQRKIFRPAAEHEIKIVVSTNVAEASVTIPDCTVVIDSCRVKEIGFDVETQMSSLLTKFASQDSMRQRRGRAGRVQKGRCFRLITVNTFGKLPVYIFIIFFYLFDYTIIVYSLISIPASWGPRNAPSPTR
jgi:ATP-dependent RNA helicase DHX57